MDFFLWFVASIVVIGLVVGALIVVYFKVRTPAAPKEGDRGFERETRLFTLFQNIEDMMDGFDSYVEETRAALEMEKVEFLREREEITRMQAQVLALLAQFRQEAAEANDAIRQLKALPSPPEREEAKEQEEAVAEATPAAAPPAAPALQPAVSAPVPARPNVRPGTPVPVVEPTGARAVSIWGLYSDGKSGEEIARSLGIALGEVNLTLKLLTGGKM